MLFSRIALCEEIRELANKHMQEIGHYITFNAQIEDDNFNRLTSYLELIAQVSCYPAELVSYDLYERACHYHDEFRSFLQCMNQPLDADFRTTLLGQIWMQALIWRQGAASRFQSNRDVWDCIDPIRPDSLLCLDNGQYEARWWKPVPIMDIEILKRTESIFVLGDAYEPQDLPGGLALQFSIIPYPTLT